MGRMRDLKQALDEMLNDLAIDCDVEVDDLITDKLEEYRDFMRHSVDQYIEDFSDGLLDTGDLSDLGWELEDEIEDALSANVDQYR